MIRNRKRKYVLKNRNSLRLSASCYGFLIQVKNNNLLKSGFDDYSYDDAKNYNGITNEIIAGFVGDVWRFDPASLFIFINFV